jgi:SpoU rRNA methylase family enzyme
VDEQSYQVLSALEMHKSHLDASRKKRKQLATAAAGLNTKLMQVMKDVNGDIAEDILQKFSVSQEKGVPKMSIAQLKDVHEKVEKQVELVDDGDNFNTYTQSVDASEGEDVELLVRKKVSFTDDIADIRGAYSGVEDSDIGYAESRLEVEDYMVGNDVLDTILGSQHEQGQGKAKSQPEEADQRDDCEDEDAVMAALKGITGADSPYWSTDPAANEGGEDHKRFFDILGDDSRNQQGHRMTGWQ